MHYVNVYFIERAYGGPEEGGWWYNQGEFLTEEGSYASRKDALAKAKEVHDTLHLSASCSRLLLPGWEVDNLKVRTETHQGRNFPRRKPHYE
jgi:hypothetical protein